MRVTNYAYKRLILSVIIETLNSYRKSRPSFKKRKGEKERKKKIRGGEEKILTMKTEF